MSVGTGISIDNLARSTGADPTAVAKGDDLELIGWEVSQRVHVAIVLHALAQHSTLLVIQNRGKADARMHATPEVLAYAAAVASLYAGRFSLFRLRLAANDPNRPNIKKLIVLGVETFPCREIGFAVKATM